jgi:hypothetical protein
MFTVLSNPRKTNLYLIVALAIMLVVILVFAVAPSIAASKPAPIPVTGNSVSPDYYQRHPELRAPAGMAVEMNGDFALRHPEWASGEQSVAVPVTGISNSLDYFQRHPELRVSNESNDLSDYFLRH